MHAKEYGIWNSMLQRCSNPNSAKYQEYGGRGISVCDAWMASYDSFIADMGPRPSPKHSIDRIDVNGNYEPGNCRWADRATQRFNTRVVTNANASGVRGVRPTRSGKWMARIAREGTVTYLGTFDSLQEAAEARRVAELELYGFNPQKDLSA